MLVDVYFANGEVIIPQLDFKAQTNTTDPLPQLLFTQLRPHLEDKILNPAKGRLILLYHAKVPAQEILRLLIHEETPRSLLWQELFDKVYTRWSV